MGQQIWISRRRRGARSGKRDVGQKAWRAHLYRQQEQRRGRGIAKTWRRKSDSRHGAEFQGHLRSLSRPRAQRVAGPGNIEVPPFPLLLGKRRLQGWASGTAPDSEDTMRFATLTGVRPMIEKFPLGKAAEAYERMNSGHAQFRVVLTM